MIVGGAFLVAGLLGAGLCALVMDKWHKFKLFYFIGLAGTTVSYFMIFLSLRIGQVSAGIVFTGCMGFFEMPLRSLGTAFMCQVAYPVSTFRFRNNRRGVDMRTIGGHIQCDLAGRRNIGL